MTRFQSITGVFIDKNTGCISFDKRELPDLRCLGSAFMTVERGCLAATAPELAESRKAIVVTYRDHPFAGFLKPIIARIGSNLSEVPVYEISSAKESEIHKLIGAFRKLQPDLVIALGGGSVIDVAKAAVGLVHQAGQAEGYLNGTARLDPDQILLPFVAVPSIVSSGSEANDCSVYIDSKNVKRSIRGLKVPYVLIDPELIASVPLGQATITGLDGMTQVIEAYLNPNAGPSNSKVCLESIRLFNDYLPRYLEGNRSNEVLTKLCIGGYLHAVGNYNVTLGKGQLGLAHGLVHLCAKYDLQHGNMVAILLPSALRCMLYSTPGATEKFLRLGHALGLKSSFDDSFHECMKVIDYLESFYSFFLRRAKLPTSLFEAQIGHEDLQEIVRFEKDKLLNGALNERGILTEDHLVMMLKGLRDFSDISVTKEKIKADVTRLLSLKGTPLAASSGDVDQIVNSILETEYRFDRPDKRTEVFDSQVVKRVEGILNSRIKSHYSASVSRISDRYKFLGIC